MKMKTACQFFVGLFILNIATGCQRTVENTSQVAPSPVATEYDLKPSRPGLPVENPKLISWKYDEVIELSETELTEELEQLIELRDYEFSTDKDTGRPEVVLSVFNRHQKEPVEFEIRTLFFRDDGSLIDSTSWIPAKASSRQIYRYQALSFSHYSTKELVQIRNLRIVDKS